MGTLTNNKAAVGAIVALAIAAICALVFMVVNNKQPEAPKGANMVIGPNGNPMQLPADARAEIERQKANATRSSMR
jgi:hypothetical protein